ncbi:RHS repeat domain-containing protein [Snodgrassella gandavensis]|uniref:RHS repeat domain-containing protein n=1 Tax=Snodgrassella gandavensis TaxID=2946698 RepID=UPI001EF504AF|nr:RHS repeat-associated core domain-containing protein [Snodgrassella gandavensis]
MRVAYGWQPDSDWGTSSLWQTNLSEGQSLKNASYHYLINDHLGTPQLAINSTGEQSWKINSDAFGNSELAANNQITMNLRFPGQYYDAETGLSYNYFRDYDAKTGRYIQSDPIGLAGGINTYGYVGGNPLVYSDPTGEIAPAVVAGAGVATAGIRLCAANPACRYMAKEAIRWGIRWGAKSLITPPILSDKADDDCRDENVEINDASSHNIIGGASNQPDTDDKQNNKNSERKLPKTKKLRENLKNNGLQGGTDSAGGYEKWVKNSDQSKVWIKPSGEVIRLQRVWRKNGLKKYNERQNYWGGRLEDQSHSTGHFVK